MPILGDATTVTARLTKSASNALRIQLATSDGTELGRAQQKGGAAGLFGFKNGGKSDYTLSPAGDELGVLTLITVHTGRHDIDSEAMQLLFDYNVNAQKTPSAGALLKLHAPVPPEFGDIMAAACVDFSVLPRGYVA
ncbi:MAG: hypothetical protein QOE30_413 [Mycobacterium sp.]|jgi:hypothetical protein|uniref:hypothetical protein n=1 Tax=Mycobacterium sp. TaxID=1785 RepID=UPI0028BA0F5B|nr:hypothetical protein [Mycobacterium sp.]MDT5114674.1 hypothetical protein [Mycobacterium sp.]